MKYYNIYLFHIINNLYYQEVEANVTRQYIIVINATYYCNEWTKFVPF